MKPDILTCGGRYFNFLDPQSCEINIEEIAHALSEPLPWRIVPLPPGDAQRLFLDRFAELFSLNHHPVEVAHA